MSRSNSSKAWLQEHVADPYVRRAKAQGYRSRAAFKLLEIDAKDHLLKPGMIVVDLGAVPGGWSQVATRRVRALTDQAGPGCVVALDVLDLEPIAGVEFIKGDFCEAATLAKLDDALAARQVDLVLSDLSPNISGIAISDQARSLNLAELAVEFASQRLRNGGALLVKVFQGGGVEALRESMRTLFGSVVVRKPRASRGRSAELYLLGRGRKA